MRPDTTLDLDTLLSGCADDSFDDGLRIDTELEPLSGPGGSVKPAIYAGGQYQQDKRWASSTDSEPTPVIVIDNVPSQANRLEQALLRDRDATPIPDLVLDLGQVPHLPAHLPRRISSLEFPHRNADAYLRDSRLGDTDFVKTDIGRSVFAATAQTCGALMAWFPQALLYGFWQSHLGKKASNAKHARAWVSEIVGWNPATTDTRTFGLKGDPLNLSVEESVLSNPAHRTRWHFGSKAEGGGTADKGAKKDKLSEIGHGQVPFTGSDAAPAAVSFARVTQRATLSFAQLRRISLGSEHSREADTAARALLVATGLHAHVLAFARGFALRSGAELRPRATTGTWLGADSDTPCDIGDSDATRRLLATARGHAASAGVPLDGWGKQVMLTPKDNLLKAIRSTWPELSD